MMGIANGEMLIPKAGILEPATVEIALEYDYDVRRLWENSTIWNFRTEEISRARAYLNHVVHTNGLLHGLTTGTFLMFQNALANYGGECARAGYEKGFQAGALEALKKLMEA